MKKKLISIISAIILGSCLLIGGGTYAFFSASTETQSNTFQAGTISLQSALTSSINSNTIGTFGFRSLTAAPMTQTVVFPMFYGYADYSAGPNPYDKFASNPSGEIPGGWAPGDQVKRYWTINNKGDASKITEVHADNFSLKDMDGNPIAVGSQAYQHFPDYMKVTIYDPDDNTKQIYSGTFGQLISAPQWLDMVICFSGSTAKTIPFVVTMDTQAGNDLQGVKGTLDFQLGAEQVHNNCFDPPFSHGGYSMQLGSTTPIKFECFDTYDNLIKSSQDVKLVISGENLAQDITYTLANGLSFDGGHYQANVTNTGNFVDGVTYTATVYNGSEVCGQKTFTTQPGSRPRFP